MPLRGGAVGENDGFEEFSNDISSIPDGVQTAYNYTTSDSKLIHADFEVTSGDVVANIPGSVITIGNTAFMDDNFITSVIMPDSVTSIEDGQFSYPGSSSNQGAFAQCPSLRNIVFSSNLTTIGTYAFGDCTALSELSISEGITHIGAAAFIYCSALTTLALPTTLYGIYPKAFLGCSALTTLLLSHTQVNWINNDAFMECSSLTTLTLPVSLTRIGSGAFTDCDSLTDIYYTGTQQQYEAIQGISNCGFKGTETIHYNYTPAE